MILLGEPTFAYSIPFEYKGILFVVALIYVFALRNLGLRFMKYRSALKNEDFKEADNHKIALVKQGTTILIITLAVVAGYFWFR